MSFCKLKLDSGGPILRIDAKAPICRDTKGILVCYLPTYLCKRLARAANPGEISPFQELLTEFQVLRDLDGIPNLIQQKAEFCYSIPVLDVELAKANIEKIVAHGTKLYDDNRRLLLFAPPGFHDYANNRELFSHHSCTQYWVWYDGISPRKTADRNSGWIGGGWCVDEPPPLPEESTSAIDAWMQRATERALELVSHLVAMQQLPKDANEQETIRGMARIILRYLPIYREIRGEIARKIRPAGADYAEPQPWKNINPKVTAQENIDTQGIAPLQRAMMLDGWITLWQDNQGNLLHHPASLAIMFWAAWLMTRHEAHEVQAFLDRYRFDGWFGGRL